MLPTKWTLRRGTKPLAGLALGMVVASCVAETEADLGSTSAAVVWGADNRTPLTEAFFADQNAPTARAIGRLDTPNATCTATHIGGNLVMTASQCFNSAQLPKDIIFRPGYIDNGVPHPSIRGKRIIRGTGEHGKLSGYGSYVPGNDWALIEVDPATYSRGSKRYPSSWTGWPAIPLGTLPNPIATPVTVSSFGYSGTLSAHYNCSVRQDGVCNYANSSEGYGIELSNCESENGAAGGPLITGWPGNPQIVAMQAGHGTSGFCYFDDIANKVVSTNSVKTAPKYAAGATFTSAGNGARLAIVSDLSVAGGVAWNNFNSSDDIHMRHQWVPWSDSFLAGRTLGRMTSTQTPDQHAFVFANTQNGIVSRWETSPGAWSNWEQWFPGASMNSNVVDLEAVSTSSVALQVFTAHSDGRLRTRRKPNASWNGMWGSEVDLGVIPGARAIAAEVVGGYQQLFAITHNAVKTSWENSPGSNQWSAWIDFTAGLPVGLELLDVSAGRIYNGVMILYVLGRDSNGVVVVYERAKRGLVGAGWGEWVPVLPVPAGTTQIEAGPAEFEGFPRLLLLNDGELLIGRPTYWDGSPVTNERDHVTPAYSPELVNSCPAAPPPLPC